MIDRQHFEKWPRVPALLDHHFAYEDLTFATTARRRVNFGEQDVTVTCSYPYSNWLSRLHLPGKDRPAHVFVTQNGDWPAYSRQRRYVLFSCDGLVCTNPEYFERNTPRWRCALIPNGFDPTSFRPGPADRRDFGIPEGVPVVLMASALASSKRVLEGIRAVAPLDDVFLVVAGDGPERDEVDALSDALMPGRFRRVSVPRGQMADLYRSTDVFLHMSKTESFGNVYVEALACGRPIVAHDSPTTRWIFAGNDRAVSLVDTEDLEAVRQAILARRAAVVDPADSRGIESQYGWPSIAERYRAFLAEVVHARRRR